MLIIVLDVMKDWSSCV